MKAQLKEIPCPHLNQSGNSCLDCGATDDWAIDDQPQEPQPETERTDGEPENELLISPKEFWLGEAQI